MKHNTHRTYAKVMLAGALAFSFVAEAANYTFAGANTASAPIAISQQDALHQWEKKLLGPYANINDLTAANIREAYTTLLVHVRRQHGSWTDQDWQQAKPVVDKLDHKKNTLESQLKLDDKVKIKAMQAEFRALETADDVQD